MLMSFLFIYFIIVSYFLRFTFTFILLFFLFYQNFN